MATTDIGNPAGAVVTNDFGVPHIIGGFARNQTVSGGCFGFGSTATGVVGSMAYNPGSLLIAANASGLQFNGIIMATTGSNLPCPLAVGGVFLLQCEGTVVGGQTVITSGRNAVNDGSAAGTTIGRALTAGASGGFALVHVNP